MSLPLVLVSATTAVAKDDAVTQAQFAAAAREHSVPEAILLALSWEASRWNPGARAEDWQGYGLFGLRRGMAGPDIDEAAELLGVAPARLETDPELNIHGAAALLRQAWDVAHPGQRPRTDELIAWWEPVRAMAPTADPQARDDFAFNVFQLIESGETDGIIVLEPEAVGPRPIGPPPPSTSDCDYAGCDDYAPACSANYTEAWRSDLDIDTIVIHTVQGSYSSAVWWFQDCSAGVSAHYVVRSKDGAVTQSLGEENIGWHAGDWDTNERSVAIELEGFIEYPEDYYTEAMMDSLAVLIEDIALRNDIPLDRAHIIGHHEVPGCADGTGGGISCHTDPGSGFDWDALMARLAPKDASTLLGVVAAEDIYDGPRIAGATVWLEGGSETQITDEGGAFSFVGLAPGQWTVRAEADGYDAGSCTTTLAPGDGWCSVALFPEGTTPEDTGPPGEDTGWNGDTGVGEGDTGNAPGQKPPMTGLAPEDGRACGCTAGGVGAGLVWLVVVPFVAGRRRSRG